MIEAMKARLNRISLNTGSNASIMSKGVEVVGQTLFKGLSILGSNSDELTTVQSILRRSTSVNKIVDGFVKQFNANESNLDAITFITSVRHHCMATIPELADVSADEIEFALEENIFPQIYTKARTYALAADEDEALTVKCSKYRHLTQEQLRIAPELRVTRPVPFHRAIATLKSIIFSQMPSRKIQVILNAAQQIYSEIAEHDANVVVGGDQFTDIWIYVTIQANVQGLSTTINYLNLFARPELLQSETGYYFTSLGLAAHYIRQMTDRDIPKMLADATTETPFLVSHVGRVQTLLDRGIVVRPSDDPTAIIPGFCPAIVEDWAFDVASVRTSVLVPAPGEEALVHRFVVAPHLTSSQKQLFLDVFHVGGNDVTTHRTDAGIALVIEPDTGLIIHRAPAVGMTVDEKFSEVLKIINQRWAMTDDFTVYPKDVDFSLVEAPTETEIIAFQRYLQLFNAFPSILDPFPFLSSLAIKAVIKFQATISQVTESITIATDPTDAPLALLMAQARTLFAMVAMGAAELGFPMDPTPAPTAAATALILEQVRALQRSMSMFPDGRLGPKTISEVLYASHLAQIEKKLGGWSMDGNMRAGFRPTPPPPRSDSSVGWKSLQ